MNWLQETAIILDLMLSNGSQYFEAVPGHMGHTECWKYSQIRLVDSCLSTIWNYIKYAMIYIYIFITLSTLSTRSTVYERTLYIYNEIYSMYRVYTIYRYII
jgi:hypothetical protein